MKQRLEAWAAQAAIALLRRLPPTTASNLGGTIARLVGPHLPISQIAQTNLRLALPTLDPQARRKIIRAMWDNLGRTIAELPHLQTLENTPQGPGWSLENIATIDTANANDKPFIMVSGHIANWEILPVAAARRGITMAGFYRAPDNPHIDALLGTLRRQSMRTPASLFPKGATGARQALQHLRQGGALGILADQKMNDGVEAQFFDRPAMTPQAPAALALRLRCPVIPVHVQRTGPARFHVVVDPPLPLPNTGDRAADILTLTQAINDRLETWIRARPESWLWLHRRWPKPLYKPTKP